MEKANMKWNANIICQRESVGESRVRTTIRCGNINLKIRPLVWSTRIPSTARNETAQAFQIEWNIIFMWKFCSHLAFTSCSHFIFSAFLSICLCFRTAYTVCLHPTANRMTSPCFFSPQTGGKKCEKTTHHALSALSKFGCDILRVPVRNVFARIRNIQRRELTASVVPSKLAAWQEPEYVLFFDLNISYEFTLCWQWVYSLKFRAFEYEWLIIFVLASYIVYWHVIFIGTLWPSVGRDIIFFHLN